MLGLTLLTRLWLNASSPLQRPTIECFELMRPHFGQREAYYDCIGLDPHRNEANGCSAPFGSSAFASFRPHSHIPAACLALFTRSLALRQSLFCSAVARGS